MSDEIKEPKRWTWEEWYESEKAQKYCFSNHNRATRDEQIGEFCFKANTPYIDHLEKENEILKARNEELSWDGALNEAEDKIKDLESKCERYRTALEKVKDHGSMFDIYYRIAREALKGDNNE